MIKIGLMQFKYVTQINKQIEMTQLLLSWLNDEVQLSKRISNFEEEFHNGYLFGELLSKYSQQLNFGQFKDKYDKAAKINNFILLYDTFKTLRVSFDSNIAYSIIIKKEGYARKVLYELKMQLEKTTNSTFAKSGKPKPASPIKKVPAPKQQFDKISKQHFTQQLNELHTAQKNLDLETHLQGFNDFHQRQIQKAQQDSNKQTQNILLKQKKFRQTRLDNLKKSQEFLNNWEHSNQQKWSANIATRKLQQEKDIMFKTNAQNSKIHSKTMSEISAIKNLDKDIKEFEKKIQRKKNQTDSSSQEQKKEVKVQPNLLKKRSSIKFKSNQPVFSVTTEGGKPKISSNLGLEQQPRKKKNPQQIELARHQRQKRRRKMIVQQNKKHHLIKIDRRQKYIMSTLQQTSKQQKQIEYQIWRAWQNKEVIIQNKNSQKQTIKQKQQARVMNTKFKNEQLTKTFREQHQKQLKEGMERQTRLKVSNSVKERKKIYDNCKSIIENFIEMAEVVYEYGQQKNQQELDNVFVTHLLDEFVHQVKDKKSIAQLELNNYIHGRGEWNIELRRDNEEQPVDPTADNGLPNAVVNNYYLGNILKTVFKDIYERQDLPNAQQNGSTKGLKCSNLIALLGLQFAGKSLLASKIKQHFGFNVIVISELVQEKLKNYETMRNKGLQIDGQTAQLADICYKGQTIPNSMIVNLLKQNIEKHEKSIIVNYPTTYQQCVELTKTFGNSEPSDYSAKSKLMLKIEQFSRLVWPTEVKIIERSLKPCGIDFAIWVEISPKTSLDRFIGRRWTNSDQCIHVNDQIYDPNLLVVGEKGSSVILKNNFKLKSKKKIQGWLNQFGIQLKDNDQNIIQKCWETVSGECPIEELTQKIFQLLKRGLEIKTKKKQQLRNQQLQLQQMQKKNEELGKFQEQLKQKCAASPVESIKQKFKSAINSANIDGKFLENIQRLWNNTEKLTISGLLNVFQLLRDQSEAKNKHISNTKRNFIRMLTRQDQRFYLAKKFQNQYNEFIDENNDMVIQDYTKQELHQRIEDLETDLLTLIQEKRQDAQAQRQNIMKSGWLQNQLDQIMSCAHIIFQIELNRTFACQQIINDFYCKKYLVNTGDPLESLTDLSMDSDLEIIKDANYPRLEKLVNQAMRLFNREEEVVDDKNKKGGKVPPPKKDDKKQAKKGGKQEIQQKSEQTPQDVEYRKAINTEKAIFRYRIKVISSFTAKKLRQFHEAGLKLYADLQDLYKYTDRIQNKAVIEMTRIFKRAIEEERKIENQVQIHYVDVIQSGSLRNFKKPKPVVNPASQKVQTNRFTISSLKQLISLFKNESQGKTSIKNNRLLSLLENLLINKRYCSLVPETWKGLTKEQHQNFIGKFDKAGKGQIDLWIIFTVMALTNCHLPNRDQIKQYELQVTDHNPLTKQVDMECLERARSWFDQQQPQSQNVRPFNRDKFLKQILFEIFKKQAPGEAKVAVDKYITKLAMIDFSPDLDFPQQPTYFNFAFPKT